MKDRMFARNTTGLTLTAFGHCVFISLTSMALPMFMTDIMYLSPAAVSLIFLISRIWDAVNDPMMGAVVDRTRTRWGKCRPYVLFASVPLLIFTMLMFMPVIIKSDSLKFLYAITAYILFITAFTMLDIPLGGLKTLLFTEPDKRNKASSISSTFGSMGSLFAIDLFFAMVIIFGQGNDRKGYFVTVVLLSIFAFGMLLAGFFTVREVIPLAKKQKSFLSSVLVVMKNKYLMIAIAMQLCSLGISAYGIMLPYFSKWNLADSFSFGAFSVESVLIPALSTATGVFYMIAVFITPYLLKLTTKKKMFLMMSVAGFIFNVASVLFGYQNLILFIVLRVFAHIPPTITGTIAGYMIMDSLDYAEYKSGVRTEGSTFAVNSLIMQIGNAVFSALVMFMLGFFGYNAAVTEPALKMGESITYNYGGMLDGIFYIMTAFPAVGLLLQTVPMIFYKLDDKQLNDIVAVLKERRQVHEIKGEAEHA